MLELLLFEEEKKPGPWEFVNPRPPLKLETFPSSVECPFTRCFTQVCRSEL